MKSQKGNAYILVMMAAMAMLLLVSATLLVTANSRQATARYTHFAGLYDLAVAGNQQALVLLQQGGMNNLRQYFTPQRQEYHRNWNFSVDIILPDGQLIANNYQATTILHPQNDSFAVRTNVAKQMEYELSFPVTVRASIVWDFDNIVTNTLDYSMLKMVELLRVAD